AVVPIFAGYDLRRRSGRIFKYDVTGGRYEEADFHATGSGGRDARTTIKLGYREGMDLASAIELSIEGLYEAADEDSATGGPDVDGILIRAENPWRTLDKGSEIYGRIAFAGVGKYNEFDALRTAGVGHADLKGWAYSREDVDARSLANAYAQTLGQVFTHEMK